MDATQLCSSGGVEAFWTAWALRDQAFIVTFQSYILRLAPIPVYSASRPSPHRHTAHRASAKREYRTFRASPRGGTAFQSFHRIATRLCTVAKVTRHFASRLERTTYTQRMGAGCEPYGIFGQLHHPSPPITLWLDPLLALIAETPNDPNDLCPHEVPGCTAIAAHPRLPPANPRNGPPFRHRPSALVLSRSGIRIADIGSSRLIGPPSHPRQRPNLLFPLHFFLFSARVRTGDFDSLPTPSATVQSCCAAPLACAPALVSTPAAGPNLPRYISGDRRSRSDGSQSKLLLSQWVRPYESISTANTDHRF